MPLNNNEKLQKFANEVLSEAYAKAKSIKDEIEAEKKRRLTESGSLIKAEASDYVQNELKKFRRENADLVHKQIMENRRKYLLRREEIAEKTREKARKKIIEFTRGESYIDYIIGLCVKVAHEHRHSMNIYLSENDMKFKANILDAMKTITDDKVIDITIITDKNIKLGGARFECVDEGIVINETFDERLDMQKDYFALVLGKSIAEK